jgi:hypothetical protein
MPADWQETATAVGTIAVAVAAVGVALYGEWRTDVRLERERKHSAKVLAEERAAADARLQRQIEHSDAQLREERERVKRAEQEVEALSVEVTPELKAKGTDTSELAVTVRNLGRHSIVQVQAQFSPDGRSLLPSGRTSQRLRQRLMKSEDPSYPDIIITPISRSQPIDYKGVLPNGHLMLLYSDEIADNHLADPFPIVRWKDYLGQRWEHRQGQVRMISDAEPWEL